MTVSESNFCIGPWSEIRILANGRLNWCHFAECTSTDNISSVNLNQYFHDASVSKVRASLLEGIPVTECNKCYKDEELTGISFRQRRNIQRAIFPKEHFCKSFNESGFAEFISNDRFKPNFYNIVLSNICNMACIMCNEDFSSRLAADFKKIGITNLKSNVIPVVAKQDWTEDPVAWDNFMSHVLSNHEIVCLHVQGGEPLIHPKFVEILDTCIANNHTDFHLTFVTNGSVYSTDLIEKLLKFKSCQIEISIEGVTGINDYVRYHSSTEKIVNNIKKFATHRSDKLDIVIRSVPQLLTVIDYHLLLKFCLENNLVIDSNIIHAPVFLHPAVLPESVKIQVRKNLEQFKSSLVVGNNIDQINLRNNSHIQNNLYNNASIVLSALDKATDPALQQRALEFFGKIDNYRGTDVFALVPDLAIMKHG